MEGEKRGFVIVIGIVILLAVINIFLYLTGAFSFTGLAIGEDFEGALDFSKIAFIAQWLIILLIVYFAYVRHLKKTKTEKIQISYSSLEKRKGKAGTDIDLLYSLLKDGKKLRVSVVAEIFNIDRERALEWMRILEDHNLALINYPAFSEPEVELYEEKEEKEDEDEKAAEKEVKEKEPEKSKDSKAEKSEKKLSKKSKGKKK
ncbi:MAG: hypothetical protein ABIH72_01580 [archaeon]